MRSIKPGRAPSMMGGIVGIIMAILGMVFLIFLLNNQGPRTDFGYPGFKDGFSGGFDSGFEIGSTIGVVFCIAFIIIAISMSIYNFVNALKRNRYSIIDITEGNEESDPLNQLFGNNHAPETHYSKNPENRFCPYCGAQANTDFEFCNICGKSYRDKLQITIN